MDQMARHDFQNHISGQLNQNLEGVFNQILEMGGLVESQLERALTALQNDDITLAKAVFETESEINREELEIDHQCASVLARQQPAASDLRLIIIAIRISVDLERMADEVVKVAKLVIKMHAADIRCKVLPGYNGLIELLTGGRLMLQAVLNAFARLDLSAIRSVFADEALMDKVFKNAILELSDLFHSSGIDVELLLEMVNALRASERVTDHSENIAESLIYLVRGEDVRDMDSETLSELLRKIEAEASV